jgi:hypothetical protein
MRARGHALILSLLSFLCLLLLIQVAAAGAPPRPLRRAQILGLLAGGVSNERISTLVKERGIDFRPTPKYLRELREAGADRGLLAAVRSAQNHRAGTAVTAAAVGHNEIAESCLTAGARLLQRLSLQRGREEVSSWAPSRAG